MLGVGVRENLDRETDIEVVGQVASPGEARQVLDETAPDVVLVNAPAAESSESGAAFVVLGGANDGASIVGAVEMGAMAHDVGAGLELVPERVLAVGNAPDRGDELCRLGCLRDATRSLRTQ